MIDAVRLVFHLDVVRAGSRRSEHHSHRATVLRELSMRIATIGVKHLAHRLIYVKQRVEVPGGDCLSDRKGVVASWHCHRHPV